MLGHASAAMNLDTYADLFDDALTAVADALDHRRCSPMLPSCCHGAHETACRNSGRNNKTPGLTGGFVSRDPSGI